MDLMNLEALYDPKVRFGLITDLYKESAELIDNYNQKFLRGDIKGYLGAVESLYMFRERLKPIHAFMIAELHFDMACLKTVDVIKKRHGVRDMDELSADEFAEAMDYFSTVSAQANDFVKRSLISAIDAFVADLENEDIPFDTLQLTMFKTGMGIKLYRLSAFYKLKYKV